MSNELEMNELFRALVGRKIIEANEREDTLTLDDGSVITFEGYGDCCAWANVDRMSRLDHVITDVRFVENPNSHEGGEDTLSIYALSEGSVDTEIVHIVGDEGTGCYSYGVRILLNGAQIESVDW